MTAYREVIFAKIEQLLSAISGISEVERMASGDPASFPALHIWDEGQSPEEAEAGTTRYALSVGIDGFVNDVAGASAHAKLNALHSAVIKALITEPPIDGLVDEITEGALRISIAERASARRLAFSLDLTLYYPTARGNPDQI